MASTKINFTVKRLEALPSPQSGMRDYYRDERLPGLLLDVTPTGTKSFYVYRKINGRPERIRIGQFPAVSIEQARKTAADYIGQIARGENPQVKRRALRTETTFGQFFSEYMEKHAKVRKKTWKEDDRQFNCYLQSWRTRRLSQITRKDVQTLHARMGTDNGHYAANHVLMLLHTVFNLAISWGWESQNPAHGIKKFPERSRERFLQPDELPRFFQALKEEANETFRDFILMSLFTAARRSNVLAMRWEQIHLGRATWTIPVTKNGTSLTVPLSRLAVTILTQRFECSTSEWVFPSNRNSGHFIEPSKAWRRLKARAGLDDLRLHDLRRTMGSWQAATGANISIIGRTLGHKSLSSTAIYARLNLDPVRESMETATDAMMKVDNILETSLVKEDTDASAQNN